MNNLKLKLAKTLRELRSLQNAQGTKLTQQDVADYVGISVKYYRELEKGSRKTNCNKKNADLGDTDIAGLPTLGVIALIAEAFDIKLSEFCRQIEEQNV